MDTKLTKQWTQTV